MEKNIIAKAENFVKHELANAEGGHDWWHIERVRINALRILKTEKADSQIVELACLLHDIADSKFYNGDEEIGPAKAENFLKQEGFDDEKTKHIIKIIRHMSFKNSFDGKKFTSDEMDIVQDADRLDAIGAIGIARAFNYGGHKGREIYNPGIKPDEKLNKEKYKNSKSPSINHFYEKLLLLKEMMNTKSGRTMAEQRHEFMKLYLEQFFSEVE